MRKLLFVVAIASCGGKGSSKPTTPPPPAEPAPAPAEPAPTPTTKTEEKPAETSNAAGIAAQADLAAQYDKGKGLYNEKKCASCHGEHGEGNPKNPALIGADALPEKAPAKAKLRKGVAFKTAKDVLDFVHAKMPLKSPGTLSDADAAAVTAWILSESKVNIDRPLDASTAGSIKLR
jgi:cytochrome c